MNFDFLMIDEMAGHEFGHSHKDSNKSAYYSEIVDSIKTILNSTHTSYQKLKIKEYHDRINFACPYCMDSHSDNNKKRGNLFLDTMKYHCYNCNAHVLYKRFVHDFNVQVDRSLLLESSEKNRAISTNHKNFNLGLFVDNKVIEKYGIPKEYLCKRFNLTDVLPDWLNTYLLKRLQNPSDKRFLYDNAKSRLVILNYAGDKIIGIQLRSFSNYGPKYVTYNLRTIYSKLKKEVNDEEFEDLNKVSRFFGLFNLDFSQPVTIFEGPLDSFLYKNSVAVCNSKLELPFDISNKRHVIDFDETGTKTAISLLRQGESVFLWKKCLDHIGLKNYRKKMDLNSLVIKCKLENIPVPVLSDFFSNNKLDMIYV